MPKSMYRSQWDIQTSNDVSQHERWFTPYPAPLELKSSQVGAVEQGIGQQEVEVMGQVLLKSDS